MRTRIWVSVVVVAFVVPILIAQEQVGTISGIVTDTTGGILPGATVTLIGPESRNTTTDTQGEFSFVKLRPGEYQVETTLTGFNAISIRVSLAAGRTERRVLAMSVSGLQETVTVGGEAPLVNAPPSAAPRSGVPGGVIGGVAGGIGALPGPPADGGGDTGRGVSASAGSGTGTGVAAGTGGAVARLGGGVVETFNTEAYDHIEDNRFRRAEADPLSTFSIDVDTASYANVRRFITDGRTPPAGAIRIEELVNYFRFDYPQPSAKEPFSVTTELTSCPWNPRHRLALVGLQGRELRDREPAARNLVFLIDVSGSMMPADKLPLVRSAMRMLTDVLTENDRVAIVVYAGASGLVLPSTSGDRKDLIHQALARLQAGGSTNGASGIRLAYQVARDNFIVGGVNRVILATDGDFNMGVTNQSELVSLIERERESGVFLSVLGVGTGNLKDSTMEKLADKGNGNYSYLDTLHEARKVLVREAGATLDTIAKDVKIQVEFNPRQVFAYRLIGYENRLLKNEDFNDDKKDAGEIGAGHSVTALYEIVPVGVKVATSDVDPLKYQRTTAPTRAASSGELMNVKVRYKDPDGDTSRLITRAVMNRPSAMLPNLGFASAVAEFGMVLRGSPDAQDASFEAAAARARRFRGRDDEGYRAEFIVLAERAALLRNHDGSTQSRR